MSDAGGVPRAIRVLIADDHAIVREGIALLIDREKDMCVIAQAGSSAEALRLAGEHAPDVAVVDISMPDTSAAACPGVRVVMLTRHADAAYLNHAWKLGARGYVLKRAAADDLVRAIRIVARGNAYVDPDLADRLQGKALGAGRPVAGAGGLTARETDVLTLVAWGYSNSEIARRLKISVKTVESYRACAVEKLNLRRRSEIVRYAIRHGWINDDAAPD
jgi:two-component system response regulator NreC